ncbi:hypothetical protein GCM10008023_19850 [Sphingomonas glacialis]|uniref:Uncharacterized protein n=1 Tax=Sphingomonas glacialis TaxID=658225 RepID=A0ABQ3LI11_9SPHN|nr:hypothetical protein [Sphingomonas glacialis]GHH16163.1 hypothetical protein GCM10008023_19850 [Sphingomonas glacialis]
MPEKNIATEKVAPEHFNQVVAHATIRDIRLIGTKFDMKPEAIEAAREIWAFQVSDDLDDWSCDNEKGTLSGTFSYTAACVVGRKKILSVTCRYLAIYRLSDICNEDAGKQFLARVGRFSAYPYFRAIFATLTQQSGMVLPPLPVIHDGPRWVTPPAAPKIAQVADTQSD